MKLILPLIVTALGTHKAMGFGACCIDFGDPYCFETDAEDCALQGGVYYGDGSTCATDAPDCVPVYGACCFDGGLDRNRIDPLAVVLQMHIQAVAHQVGRHPHRQAVIHR